jgi:diguanylate cyclase (GGDEF)-like protein
MSEQERNQQPQDELKQLREEKDRLAEANRRLNEQMFELYTLYNISKKLAWSLELGELFDGVMNVIGESLKVDEYCLMLIDEPSRQLVIRTSHGMREDLLLNANVSVGVGVSGKVAQSGEILHLPDISQVRDFFYYQGSNITQGSFLGVPLKLRNGKVIGVLNAHKPAPHAFSENDIRFFSAVAEHVAVAVEHALAYQQTKELSNRDELTNLYNRRYFFERFEKEVERAKRYERILSLIMIDIDHFKNYNDSFGHLMGDALLQKLAQIMEQNLRKADVLARYGGEEFFILLPETDKEQARQVAEKLRRTVEEYDFHADRTELQKGKVTITLGLASLPRDALEALSLLDLADKALYFGKAQGRNRVSDEVPEEKRGQA